MRNLKVIFNRECKRFSSHLTCKRKNRFGVLHLIFYILWKMRFPQTFCEKKIFFNVSKTHSFIHFKGIGEFFRKIPLLKIYTSNKMERDISPPNRLSNAPTHENWMPTYYSYYKKVFYASKGLVKNIPHYVHLAK